MGHPLHKQTAWSGKFVEQHIDGRQIVLRETAERGMDGRRVSRFSCATRWTPDVHFVAGLSELERDLTRVVSNAAAVRPIFRRDDVDRLHLAGSGDHHSRENTDTVN